MKILIVANFNTGRFSPFVVEQVDALRLLGIVVEYYGVVGKGGLGYLKNRKPLIDKIKLFQPDIIHAHYGLSGLLANLQRKVPVITTFHGGDIDEKSVLPLSRICMFLSVHSIFVSDKNINTSGVKSNFSLIPCGVDTDLFNYIDKEQARKKLGLNDNQTYVLFSGSFDNKDKNSPLAKLVLSQISGAILLELKGYTRSQVCLLMNSADAVLMTSFAEGSPQFIKEAMACNCPIVSVPVGDVEDLLKDVDGCYISTFEPQDIAEKLSKAIHFGKQTQGRIRIEEFSLDSESVALKILTIYDSILNSK